MELCNDPILIEAYKEAHAKGAAWPEITQGMKDVGIIDMEIYLIGTKLFMIMDTVDDFDHDKAMTELATKPRQSEWEAHMSQFQDSSAEATADQKWQLMERIYKMDE
jgi:L-rhamnose mutarotase